MSTYNINSYPSKLPNFNNNMIEVLLETNFTLTYGKKRNNDGTYQLYASIRNNVYPYDLIESGEKENISVYKVGGLPSASWTVNFPSSSGVITKNIYLFLSQTTSYISDQSTLPPDISINFDSEDISLDLERIKNKNTLYEIVQEIGSYFDPNVSYRKFAIVKSSINGKLYEKITDEIETTSEQLDPYEDDTNWCLLIRDNTEDINTENFVDLDSIQTIRSKKIFSGGIYKSSANINSSSLELLCKAECDNFYLGSNDIAKDSKKLNGLECRETSIQKNVIVSTNSIGKIDDSFLPFSIISNISEKVLTVNPNGVVDNINTFSSIQDAYNAASKFIRLSPVRINVSDGIYSSSKSGPLLNLNSTYDNSMISIIGNISNPRNCILRFSSSQQGIYFCGNGININGFMIQQEETDKGESVGINVDFGATMILGNSIIIDNCKYGLRVSNRSFVKAESINIFNCEYASIADNSTINMNYSIVEMCNIGCLAENNSTIYSRGSSFNKRTINSGNTIGYISEYNSVIRAEETYSICDMDIKYKDVSTSGTPNQSNGIIVFN